MSGRFPFWKFILSRSDSTIKPFTPTDRRFIMFRSLIFLALAAFFVSTLAGCIVVDGHHRGHLPPGQAKKMKY